MYVSIATYVYPIPASPISNEINPDNLHDTQYGAYAFSFVFLPLLSDFKKNLKNFFFLYFNILIFILKN